MHLSFVAVERSTGRCGHRAGSEALQRETRSLYREGARELGFGEGVGVRQVVNGELERYSK